MSIAQNLRIAVAANFHQTLLKLAHAFEAQHNIALSISSASSGKHYAQILHGAPFDVFLSADQDKIDRLISSDHVKEKDSFIYAQGQLALFSSNPKFWPMNLQSLKQENLRLAMANPKLAPYGMAAQSFLNHLGISKTTKMITGENIAQAFHFTNSGNADLGLVALSQLIKDQSKESYKVVPQTLYKPILQKGAVLHNSGYKEQGRIFLTFLQSKKAKAIMQRFGYQSP
ncbi:molybdate ABC transporter substrate-binding protein [Bermanella marisrubri]|uniref:molybdate ABC transporter substrate-binding protein n=1 Tax=Bermanella marisrubri TaxID=207949 RepID=UPI001403268B|nr:molybdate ABC transporter substrate-binding protein [Bermanella marisrubri]QIZ85561.1 molybdate ABC transporter substrate-binding protein [Bermanella marisrubri]